jgi:hypothetical protein
MGVGRIHVRDDAFRISREEVGVVLTWVGYIEQARIALELEDNSGHTALCEALQKATDVINRVLSSLPPA